MAQKTKGESRSVSNLIPLTRDDIIKSYSKRRFGRFTPLIKNVYDYARRVFGQYSYKDQLKIACCYEPPMFFMNNGVMIPHAYGITLSVDEIGGDVYVGQNVTFGTNAKNMSLEDCTDGHKPKIGNLVRIYTHAVVSGEIYIGDCVIIAAGAIVTKDVPSKSIVYNRDEIRPLEKRHINYLRNVLYHCERQYVKVPALVYKQKSMYINLEYLEKRNKLVENLRSDNFQDLIYELF